MVLTDDIRKNKVIRMPIVVDRRTGIILDGHHRTCAAKKIGIRKIPALIVDYNMPDIEVYPRRNIKVSKNDVIRICRNNEKYPSKTTKHVFPFSIDEVNIHIKNLI